MTECFNDVLIYAILCNWYVKSIKHFYDFKIIFFRIYDLYLLNVLYWFFIFSSFLLRNKGPIYIYLTHVFRFGYVFLLKAFYAPWGIKHRGDRNIQFELNLSHPRS